MKSKLTGVFAAILLFGLAACGDKSEPKQASAPAAKPAGAAAAAPADPLAPRYDASMAQGIDFSKPGYPTFLAEVQGMSGREDWGRWTDGNRGPGAKFRFAQPLPKSFTLVMKAGVFGPNLGKPVKVRVGGVEKTFVHKDPAKPDTYRIAFDLPAVADTIEIVPPEPTSPQSQNASNKDSRKLGVGLFTMQFDN